VAIPKTRQIIEQLSRQIAEGHLRPGDRLPSASELRRQYGVSVTVVRNAMLWLKARQLVEGVPGVGVFVADRVNQRGL
jgi:DNA-binding GntR family transcriptional regulator